MIEREVIARVGSTRWVWTPDLQRVEVYWRTLRTADHTLYLTAKQNTEAGALRAILAYETRFRG
jgi:hypothetical protein